MKRNCRLLYLPASEKLLDGTRPPQGGTYSAQERYGSAGTKTLASPSRNAGVTSLPVRSERAMSK